MGRSTPLEERKKRKEIKEPIIGFLASLVAALSIATFIGFSVYVQSMQSLFKQLGGELPFPTKLIVLGSSWMWLGAVCSGMTWWAYRQRRLSKPWSLGILIGIAIFTIVYVVLGSILLYLRMFAIFDMMK
jgi:apolipoprotein N-acyltransferase